MLKQRIITALILAPLLLLAVVFLETPALALLLAAVILIGGWEWTRLAALRPVESLFFYLALAGALFATHYYPGVLGLDDWLLWSALLWWAGISVIILRYEPREVDPGQGVVRLSKAMMGLIVLVPAWWSLVQLHGSDDHGASYFLYVFFIVWAADVGAYFSGKRFGRHKLAPLVSPGKTIEGMLGGLLCVSALAALAAWWFGYSGREAWVFVALSLLAALFSVFGDLFESLLKRQANIKDSSSLLPGHGGVLDRIDSVLAAAPVFLFGITLFLAG